MKTLTYRLAKHFLYCAAAGAAIVGDPNRAEAAVHYSGVVNIPIPSTVNGLYLNIVTGAYNVTGGTGNTVPGWTINPWGSTNLTFWVNPSPTSTQHILQTTGGGVANLPPGSVVGPSPTFGGWTNANVQALSTGSEPFILNSSANLYGFRFTYNDGTHYGWARIALGNSFTAQPRTLVEYAWEDQADAAIGVFLEPFGVCCVNSTCQWVTLQTCLANLHGTWIGGQTNCGNNPCGIPPCPADIAPAGGDQAVNVADLLAVINAWGACPTPPASCSADVVVDGVINVADLLFIINNWGACP